MEERYVFKRLWLYRKANENPKFSRSGNENIPNTRIEIKAFFFGGMQQWYGNILAAVGKPADLTAAQQTQKVVATEAGSSESAMPWRLESWEEG